MNMNRRTFVVHSLIGSAAFAAAGLSRAEAVKLAEADPQAAALGYKEVAAKVDKAKFPKYAAGQHCANCQLYQGPAIGAGNCAIFSGKQVASGAWCNAYVKKV